MVELSGLNHLTNSRKLFKIMPLRMERLSSAIEFHGKRWGGDVPRSVPGEYVRVGLKGRMFVLLNNLTMSTNALGFANRRSSAINGLKNVFWKAPKSAIEADFNRAMDQMKLLSVSS